MECIITNDSYKYSAFGYALRRAKSINPVFIGTDKYGVCEDANTFETSRAV